MFTSVSLIYTNPDFRALFFVMRSNSDRPQKRGKIYGDGAISLVPDASNKEDLKIILPS